MKNFSIFKNTYKENENQPDYKMSAKETEDGDYKEIGACWLKDGKDGSKYFSCKLSDEFTNKDGEKRSGYNIVIDGLPADESHLAAKTLREEAQKDPVEAAFDGDEIKASDIPF